MVSGGTVTTDSLQQMGASFFVYSDGTLDDPGDMELAGGTVESDAGTIMADTVEQSGGTLTLLGGSYAIAATYAESAGSVSITEANLLVGDNFHLEGGSVNLGNTGSVSTNLGFHFAGLSQLSGDGADNRTVSYSLVQGLGIPWLAAAMVPAVSCQTVRASTPPCTPTLRKSLQIDSGGVLNNTYSGAIGGDLINAGTINLDNGTTLASLTITGNFTQMSGGVLNLSIAQLGYGFGASDLLNVGGVASLDGTLNVQALNGYQPSPGSGFQVLQASSISGSFEPNLPLPGNGGSWSVLYNQPPGTLYLLVNYPHGGGDGGYGEGSGGSGGSGSGAGGG